MRAIWKGSISFGLVNIPIAICGDSGGGAQVSSPSQGRLESRELQTRRGKGWQGRGFHQQIAQIFADFSLISESVLVCVICGKPRSRSCSLTTDELVLS